MTHRLVAAALLMLTVACAPDVSPGGVSFEPRSSAPPGVSFTGKDAALHVLEILPAPGTQVLPRLEVTIRFDRALDPASLHGKAIKLWYPEPRATFLEDPFRLSVVRFGKDAATLIIEPPPLLPGREVRLELVGLRGSDGAVLSDEDGGDARSISWRVLELPP
jgi:hypothetical protein